MTLLLNRSLVLAVVAAVFRALAVQNGDFEKGNFDGWGGFWGDTTEVTTAAGHHGLGAHIAISGAAEGGLYQDVPGVAPGAHVRANVAFAVPAGEALTGDSTIVLRIEISNAAGEQTFTADHVLATASSQPASGAWKEDSFEVDAPADTTLARVVLLVESPGKQKSGAFFDDVTFGVVEVPAGGTTDSGCSAAAPAGLAALALVVARRRRAMKA